MLNVFRKSEDPSIICLIPDASPIPTFLKGRWTFEGKTAEDLSGQAPVHREAARETLWLTGFYVFAES